jgi:pilus assembly protein CpaC
MNQKRNTCALLALTLTTLPALSPTANAGTPVAKTNYRPAHTRAVTRRVHNRSWSRRSVARAQTMVSVPLVAPLPSAQPSLAGCYDPKASAQRMSSSLAPAPIIPLLQPSPVTTPINPAAAKAPQKAKTIIKTLHAGESDVLEFDGITTTAVGDPAVADIVPLSTRRLLINAKSAGKTTIFVFDSRGKNIVRVSVEPGQNMIPIAQRIEEEIGVPTITVRAVNDTIFLEGSAPTQASSSMAEAIASAYTPKVKNLVVIGEQTHILTLSERYEKLLSENLANTGIEVGVIDEKTIALTGKYASPIGSAATQTFAGDIEGSSNSTVKKYVDPLERLLASLPTELKVVNLINFQQREAQQILVRTRIIDIDRNSTKNIGLDWGSVNYTGGTAGGRTQFEILPGSFRFGQPDGPPTGNLLGGGNLARLQPLGASLSALITENKARVLSEPSMLVLDGNEGSILVGGELPIPVIQPGGGSATTILYRPFGIRLSVAPTIVSDDTIQLTVTPEVSQIDNINGIISNGNNIPALSVRRETSTLQMKDGQTLVIGGLYSNNLSRVVKEIPLLSKIPILGEFFKQTSTKKDETELLVLVEAQIVKPTTKGIQPPAPGSLENLGITRPHVRRHEFDQDYPEIQNFLRPDGERPKEEIFMPDKPTTPDGK